MTLPRTDTAEPRSSADLLTTLVRNEGSAAHPLLLSRMLLDGPAAARNFADAVHYLTELHGRHPGVIDYATERERHPAAQGWLQEAAIGFAQERAALTQMVVAAGPLPSTPGQAESEAAVLQQAHALDMLAQSDRHGTALGAALALALDWKAIRSVLDAASARLGMHLPACALPDERETRAVILAVADTSRIERAIGFGARQMLAQHRGLWDLLDARRAARGA